MPSRLATKAKNRLYTKPKAKIIDWVARVLNDHERGNVCASLGDGVQFGPGSKIDNPTGNPQRIVVGERTFIRGTLVTFRHGGKITVGDWCYIGHQTEIWSMDTISIGNRVLIAHNVSITDNTAHSLNAQERHEHYRTILTEGHPRHWEKLPGVSASPIVIEDDVWISFGVTILKGVRIGAGSVIAANSVVAKDVPPGMLYRCEIKPIMRPLEPNERTVELTL